MLRIRGVVLKRTGSRTWACQIARFLRKRNINEEEHPLGVLELNVTQQILVLVEDKLYMRTNYNMMLDHFYPTGGWEGNPGVYEVKHSPLNRFDMVLTRLEPFVEVRKGEKHPQNMYPRDHERSMREGLYNEIVSVSNHPDGEVDTEITVSPPILNTLRERFEDVPVIDGEQLNAWWIKTPETEDAYWVRFLDTTLSHEKDGAVLLRIKNKPRGLYRKATHEEKWITEPFFRRVAEEPSRRE